MNKGISRKDPKGEGEQKKWSALFSLSKKVIGRRRKLIINISVHKIGLV